MVHELTLEYQMQVQELLQKVHPRRMMGEDAHEVCQNIVLADTDSIEVLRKIVNVTSGRVLIGMRAVAFEDAKDATVFKLVL